MPFGWSKKSAPSRRIVKSRVRVLAAGVSLPDIMAREGVHPETPPVPFTPGWDLVGVVDRLGAGVAGVQPGQMVAAMPIHGAYAGFVCLPRQELVPVPPGLDAAEAVCLVLNYITASSLTLSAVLTSGIPARLSVLAGGWWAMALSARFVGRD
jgi:NADPH:quinone reductase